MESYRFNHQFSILNLFQGHHLQQHPPVSQSSLTDMNELLNLVTAQQSTLQSQQADIRQVNAKLFLLATKRYYV